VVKIDAARHEVVVGPREALLAHTVVLRDLNWLGDEPFETAAAGALEVLARIRSTGPLQPATLLCESGTVLVELADGEEGVSPGQACVFYAATGGGERLLGGGWIKSAQGAFGTKDAFPVEAPLPAEAFLVQSR